MPRTTGNGLLGRPLRRSGRPVGIRVRDHGRRLVRGHETFRANSESLILSSMTMFMSRRLTRGTPHGANCRSPAA
ncbi:hypothetical protein [Streptomyces sp. NPDC018833]|uniref:hypothetical protein n=1 Tax=Streptomyces sp. NPDC018833 TaxID=3365053 RepID=UPI00379FC7C6